MIVIYMMKTLCLVYLFVLSVSSNPLNQLVQLCNVCPPASYSNPGIQQPSNTNPYPQDATVQIPSTYSGPLGDTLNQIILSRILTNPSLQKFTDPNTKLYNQNGEEVQRKGVNKPNVINNYFIVPPEFFNINETISKNDDEVIIAKEDKAVKKPRRRKLKKKLKKVKPSSAEDEEETKKKPGKKQKQNKSESMKRKRKLINTNDSDEMIDEIIESQETVAVKDPERRNNKPKNRRRKKKQEIVTTPPSIEESGEDFQELEDLRPVIENRREKVTKKSRLPEDKPSRKVIDDKSYEILEELKPKFEKVKTFSSDRKKESDDMIENKIKKNYQNKSSDKKPENKILGNIEIPTDISNKVAPESRPTRDSKKNAAKKEPLQKITNTPKKEPPPSNTPFPDDVMKNFYSNIGNYYNSNSNYPYNFDQYNQYINPVRNPNASRNNKKTKTSNKKTAVGNSNTHVIEIKLKPKKKENVTETAVTTETPKEVPEVIVSIEVDESSESIEKVTVIPMEKPQKVSPATKDDALSSSRESFETFSKLEDLHEFIKVELGSEDEVPPISNNGIINDYYPIFDEDVYYNPYAEKINNLDDRYLYNTENNDSGRKLDRYEDARDSKDTNSKRSQSTDTKTRITDKIDPEFDKSDQKEYFEDLEEQHDVIGDVSIRRVKVPSKNTMVKPENVETVFAGSKVVKYGAVSSEDEHNIDENSYTGDGSTTYVVAKSLGRPDDYNW